MARAVEILGDRWTLLIVRDLSIRPRHFNELERGLPGIPRALLSSRLRRLQKVGVVEKQNQRPGAKASYQLTQAGAELIPLITHLTQWGARWAFGDPEPEELNALLLLWWMHDRVHTERLPDHRVVVEFDFVEERPRRYWLVLRSGDVSLCIQHPGFEIDMLVTACLADFLQVWLGRITFAEAEHDERIQIDAVPALARAFPTWFALSPVAGIVRETQTPQMATV